MVSDVLVRVTVVGVVVLPTGSVSISQSFGPPEMMSLPPPPLIVLNARAADDRVVAGPAVDDVVAAAAGDRVVARAADDRVVAVVPP